MEDLQQRVDWIIQGICWELFGSVSEMGCWFLGFLHLLCSSIVEVSGTTTATGMISRGGELIFVYD